MSLQPGTRLGPYEIECLLGEGGMGVVYKAHDLRLKRAAAIKVLPQEFAADAGRRRRFEQEAQAASALNHSNIATIYGIDSQDGTSFIAMEYVPGRTLASVIPRSGLDLGHALRYAVQIADALARAHAGGVIHRDLKPGNVMVTPDDEVKLLDFGIAKLIHPIEGSAPDVTRTTDNLSAVGLVIGTTRYMSPEQAQGQQVDPRSDIFSFGALLYEMITGRAAFEGDSVLGIASAVIRETPKPLADAGREIPGELERIVARCLRKDPERRFQTAADLKVALEELRDERDSGERSPAVAAPRRRRGILLAAALAAGVAAPALWWALSGHRTPVARVASEVQPLTSDPGDETMPSLSPDGTQVVYVTDAIGSNTSDLHVLAVDTGARITMTNNGGRLELPRWSPDGKWIAFRRRDHGLFLVSPLGGQERRILEWAQFSDYCWMPDGRRILYASGPGGTRTLQIVDIQSGETQRVGELPHFQLLPFGSALAVSADGALMATGETDPASQEARIVIRRLSGDLVEQSAIRFGQSGFFIGIQFLPGRQGLVYSAGLGPDSVRLYRSSLDGPRGERLADTNYVAAYPALSPRADRLAFVRNTTDENLYKLAIGAPGGATGTPAAFAPSNTRESSPNISFDGSKVAFASRRTGAPEIFVTDGAGEHAQRLTSMRATIAGSPRFSPDGKSIVFDSRQEQGQSDIFVMPADGGPPKNLSNHASTDSVPTWSRDGRFIYFHSNRNGSSQVWKMRADGSDPRPITRGGGYIAFESHDRTAIFFSKSDAGDGLWTAGSDGGNERMLVSTLFRHNIAPGRSGVYLSTARGLGGGPEILFYRFTNQTTSTVLRLPRPVGLGLSLAPDESWLLFSQIDGSGADLMLIDGFSAGR